ncbi:putative tellurite resistance protein B-like protein [Sinorhizobium fredii]
MFERFRTFLEELKGPAARIDKDDPRIAVIGLCFQVMEADGAIRSSERRKMRKLIKEHYKLDDAALNALVAAGETAESEAIDFYRFTAEIKRRLSEEQRVELVGMLWDIVYADGRAQRNGRSRNLADCRSPRRIRTRPGLETTGGSRQDRHG